MFIQRQIESEILTNLRYFPVVGIIGSRQVGKTTLAKMIQQKLAMPTLHLDLELEEDIFRLQNAQAYLQMHSNKCIIIDEVQRLPTLFSLLRALIDQDRKPARFILLGSASPHLIRHSSESLAGRIAYAELSPFSLLEVQPSHIDMSKHWFWGGFPGALLAPEEQFAKVWLQNFIYTYLEKDIRLLGYDIQVPLIERLLKMLAHLHGSMLNISDISRSLGISVPTVNKYIDLLEGSFMIRRLQPFTINLGKRLVKSPKIYIRDTGILHYLANLPSFEALLGHPIIGTSFEGYVIEQIYRCLPNQSWKMYYHRTHTGAEVDLILISPNGNMTCIEIKNTNTPKLSKGFYQSVQDLQPQFQYIITPNSEKMSYSQDILVCNLQTFLDTELLHIA